MEHWTSQCFTSFFILYLSLFLHPISYTRDQEDEERSAMPRHFMYTTKKDEGFMKSYWRAVSIIKLVENKISSTFISALRRKGDIMYHVYCILYIHHTLCVHPTHSLFSFLCERELSAMAVHLYGDGGFTVKRKWNRGKVSCPI